MLHMSAIRLMLSVSVFITITACSTSRPVLYPNSHLNTVGREIADQDIHGCMELARDSGADDNNLADAAIYTAGGAAAGGATGAAIGAVTGNPGRGAAAGAAGGAAAGISHAVLGSGHPDPVYRRFVDKCLRDKGYDPLGWK